MKKAFLFFLMGIVCTSNVFAWNEAFCYSSTTPSYFCCCHPGWAGELWVNSILNSQKNGCHYDSGSDHRGTPCSNCDGTTAVYGTPKSITDTCKTPVQYNN